MPIQPLPVILILAWALLAAVVVQIFRSVGFLYRESKGAPLGKRLGLTLKGLMLTVVIFAATATSYILFPNAGIPATVLAGLALIVLLLTIASRFGERETIIEEHRIWIRGRMEDEVRRQSSDMQAVLQKQTASLEDGIRNLERTKSALLNVMEDLSEEKDAANESKLRVSAILDGIADGIVAIGVDDTILLVNPVMERWISKSRDMLIGTSWREVLQLVNERGEPATEVFSGLLAGGADEEGRHRDLMLKVGNDALPVSIGIAPVVFDGRRTGSVVVFRDVTVEKRIDRAKSEFISVASHQLRTPLTSINWYVESILSKDYGRVPKPIVEPLETVHSSGRRLASLINALLNVSRIEMGHLRIVPAPIDLNDVCEEVLRESTPMIVQKDLKIELLQNRDIPKVPLDLNLVKIVIQNLIANAVKYTPPKGKVGVRLVQEGDMVVLTVSDTGCGIPEAQHSSVFKKMFRADNAVKTVPDGTGLGLYISKSIVEQFGGSIAFTSKENMGTTFTVRLPLTGVKPREGRQTLLAEHVV